MVYKRKIAMKLQRTLFVQMIALVALVTASVTLAKSWEVKGAKEFAKGELEGVSLRSTGEIRLAPEINGLDGVKSSYIWDLSVSPTGEGTYAGTGSPAAVLRIEGDEVERLHTTSEAHVTSVLALKDGSVLAATAPRGIVYRIKPDGPVSVFADLEVRYVWDMVSLSGRDWPIYCATGVPARILELTEDGGRRIVYESSEQNLMCLAPDKRDSTIYAGSQPSGLVYKISTDGDVSVLYDAREKEVHALSLSDDGVLYAATAQADKSRKKLPTAGNGNRRDGGSTAPQSGSKNAKRNGRNSANNSVYRIHPEKGASRVMRLNQSLGLSLVVGAEEKLMVGTGGEGRLLEVDGEENVTVVEVDGADDVTALVRGGDTSEVIVGTSNSGQLLKRTDGYSREGRYVSRVYDAGYLSSWGRVTKETREPKGTSITIQLRVGNTEEPGESWTEWRNIEEDEGQLPLSRFGQLRAVMSTTRTEVTPELLTMTAYYRQCNRRPDVRSLSIDGADSGDKSGRGKGKSRNGQERKTKLTRVIRWKATDPNDDPLVYDLYYRGLYEENWKEIEEDIKGRNRAKWDTQRVPDGKYLLRLVVTDRMARARAKALTDSEITAPFLVDNTRPRVVSLKSKKTPEGNKYIIEGKAKDESSVIEKISVSRNGQQWKFVFPTDNMFDARSETFTYTTKELEAGEHVFVFAARDSAGNVGSDKYVIKVSGSGKGERSNR